MAKTDLLFLLSFDTIKIMKKIFSSKICKLTFALFTLCFAISCKSNKVEISKDLSAAQLIQLGQNEYAQMHYAKADAYYIETLSRFGNDLKCYTEARYELAHSFVKQKKYEEAKKMFEEIIAIFDNPEALYQVQPKYKKLAQIELTKIEELTKEKK